MNNKIQKLKVAVRFEASDHKSKAEIFAAIDDCLKDFFDSQSKRAYRLSPGYSNIVEALRKITMPGGKRHRPYLVLLAYQGYGGTNFQAAVKVAVAIELLHTAMLVHDDIIDNEHTRHGVDNVSGQYKKLLKAADNTTKNRYAHAMSLLAGDMLLSSTYELIGQSGFSHQQRQAVQNLVSDAVFKTIGGVAYELNAPHIPPEESNPIRIAEQKTAYYSFVLPLTVGAVLAGAPDEDITHLETFGIHCGIGFQLKDDVDDIANGTDLRSGILSYTYRHALEHCTDEERRFLEAHFGKEQLDDTVIQKIRDIISTSGAKQATTELIAKHAKDARWAVEQLHVGINTKSALYAMIETATGWHAA